MYVFRPLKQLPLPVCSHHSEVSISVPPTALSYWLHITFNSLLTLKDAVSQNECTDCCCSGERAELFVKSEAADVAEFAVNITIFYQMLVYLVYVNINVMKEALKYLIQT